MSKWIFIILSPLLFVWLWKFIESWPALFARTANWIRHAHPIDAMRFVFSAATANNREAEFVDDQPIAGRRLIRLFHALLVISYVLFVIYMLKKL